MVRQYRLPLIAVLGIMALVAVASITSNATVPTEMTVQGKLTDASGDPVAPGPKTFTFKIFDSHTGGTEVWPASAGEEQVLTTDSQGLWIAQIGLINPLTDVVFESANRWLEVTVDDGINPSETLSRVKLNTIPYTFRSERSSNADQLGGQLPSAYAAASHPHEPADITPQGVGSLLDADMLDGNHADAFADFSHTHLSANITDGPGIAWNFRNDDDTLSQVATLAEDVVVCTLSVPSEGYVLVQANALFLAFGTTDRNQAYLQVDDSEGGEITGVYPYTAAGLNGYSTIGSHYESVSVSRVFTKQAGTHMFRLEAIAHPLNSANAITVIPTSTITATFYPTAYGSIPQ